MSSPVFHPLTVLLVSSSSSSPLDGTLLRDVDDYLDVEHSASPAAAATRLLGADPEGSGFDALVCEHDPPQVDCVEFVETVRSRHSTLPVIVVSAEDAPAPAEAALATGATDVVQTHSSALSPALLANRIRLLATSEGAASGPSDGSATPTDHESNLDGERGGDSTADVDRLSEAAQELRAAGGTEAVADVLLDATADVLDAAAGVFAFDDDENILSPEAIASQLSEYYGGETTFGPGMTDSITWQVFIAGDSLLFEDLRTSGIHVNEATDARSGVFVPIGGHGVLVAATDEVGEFSESSRARLELLAATAATTLDRLESRTVLRQRDRRLHELDGRLNDAERLTELLGSVEAAISGAENREAVESAILDSLVDPDWYDFGWIGAVDPDTDRLVPREWAGNRSQYLDELSLTVGHSDEPSCRTARERQVSVVQNVAEHIDGDGWARDALSLEIHSVLSVPMTYDGVPYGVLTLYAAQPDGFPKRVISNVERIAELTAYAIRATERTPSMLTDDVTQLELSIEAPGDVLNLIAANIGTTIEFLDISLLADGSTKLQFSVSGVTAESVLATTSGLVTVESVTHVAGAEGQVYTVVVDEKTVGSAIADAGGAPGSIVADGSSLVATVNVPELVDAETFTGRLKRRYPDVQLLTDRKRDRASMTRAEFLAELDGELTDRQMEVLRTAFGEGFFDLPRDATGQDVADELGVSQPTVSHHLRAGQGTLFSLLFDDE